MSKFILYFFYFTSFLPLWVSILFIDLKSCIEQSENLWAEKISICLILFMSVLSMTCLHCFLKGNSKEGSSKVRLNEAIEDKKITSEYLLSYILPLFSFDFTKWDQIILFLIFFLTLSFLCIRHNYFNTNILMEILGYKIYICIVEDENGTLAQRKIITKRSLSIYKGDYVYLKSLNNEIKLDIV